MPSKRRSKRAFKKRMEKKHIFSHPATKHHYTADAFAIRCFDNRFWKTFKRFMRELGLKDIDPESVAGGAKVLSSPEKRGDRDFMLREIAKSAKLHGTKKIMLFTHTDCGAYGGIAKFNGDEKKEFAFHLSEHKKANSLIKRHFPKLKVAAYFIDTKGITVTSHLL